MNELEVLERLRQFTADRDWAQFHTTENLAKSISIEAGELLQLFQWNGDHDVTEVAEELADVLTYCFLLADRLALSPSEIVASKLEMTREKYPIDKARGTSERYDRL